MIILDTNVLSELARIDPEPNVVTWLDSLPAAEVAITAITAAELLYGVARLPEGRRKASLAETIDALVKEDFRGSIEPFDNRAAEQYAIVVVSRERRGGRSARRMLRSPPSTACTAQRWLPVALKTSRIPRSGLIDPWDAAI